ncbi:WcaF family extracellular polysaccharide biosynthesis acetyltransferase [Adhaeribacter rhizoryzae]|uniref:Colanic acid biosynthesis acetyltransferase WcaF n=1 Tax=Adhaeribacter rhizoryzae TaxID=2607907 RepID=A0A5M6DRA1_9BACT|nr:WcaF family extracellular polysaccharide biosynthesis acetyltransferase [Adhaeribacter rhizoryzae]KAA5548779.1 colanic acid biosynthesis acetyltransferase WcaF [Adhaeribacter rhizoryzae]
MSVQAPVNQKVNLSKYNNDWYNPGGSALKRTIWFFINGLIFINPLVPVNGLKIWLLRLFGAKVGQGVVIKPNVNIKYPWLLTIGNHVWVGEKVWIDSLAPIIIHDHVTLSQGAMLLTGSHNYKAQTFDLMVNKIILEEGVWIGAQAVVCPGVTCYTHSILAVGSVATTNLEPYFIYQGNPAEKKRERIINA